MSPSVIRIAKSGAKNAPTLPPDAVTRTFGIFGSRGSGKTTTGRVLVEGMCATGGSVLVLDPVGVWWGATRAGEGPGIEGVVIGGEHADVPLEETGGKLIAELALSRQYPLIVVDMKELRKGAARRFLADHLEELYHRNRLPLSVVFEEADQALPQTPRGMDPILGRVLGAAEDIVKLGRSRGLGAVLISQRMATVNKNVTEQTENLILMGMAGPRDRKAAKEWIEGNGDPAVTDKVLGSLASLELGEGWLYSPRWLRLLERLRMRASRTLDSSATPTAERAREQDTATRAPVSLEELRTRMAESVERVKENDPKELRKRIAELERQIEAQSNMTIAEPVERVVEIPVPILEPGNHLETVLMPVLEEMPKWLKGASEDLRQLLANVEEARAWQREAMESRTPPPRQSKAAPGSAIEERPKRAQAEEERMRDDQAAARAAAQTNGGISRPQQKILDSLAWFASIGVLAPRRSPLGAVAGSSPKSSGFEKNLSTLRTLRLIDYPERGRVALTEPGSAMAEWPTSRATEAELQEAIYRMVSGPQAAILRELVEAYPTALDREELARVVGVSAASSGFEKNLSTLRSFELAEYPQRGSVVATELLFVNVRR